MNGGTLSTHSSQPKKLDGVEVYADDFQNDLQDDFLDDFLDDFQHDFPS